MNNITKIVREGLCTGCGLCVGCRHIIPSILDKPDILVPLTDESCRECGACLKKCPAALDGDEKDDH